MAESQSGDTSGQGMEKKSIGIRIFLGIVAVAFGLAVQVVGAMVAKVLGVFYLLGVPNILFTIMGFVVMGYCINKWAIKG